MNIYGLNRSIPEPIKRTIRQSCGFGCVLCGSSIIEYEHVDPEFNKARTHDPNCITLLCPTCHSKVTRGFISKKRIKEAMKSPICKQLGHSSTNIEIGNQSPNIQIGGLALKDCKVPISVRGWPVISFEEPEQSGSPYRLSASFFNGGGLPSLLIRKNEWITSSSNWDVEVVGGQYIIRSAPREISLHVEIEPDSGLIIKRINMQVLNYQFIGDKDELDIRANGKRVTTFANCSFSGFGGGLSLW